MAANVPAVFGAYQRHANIAYGPDPQHRLDVYVPRESAAAPRPVIVFWHGGRWKFGDKADYRFVGAALAELGLCRGAGELPALSASQNARVHG